MHLEPEADMFRKEALHGTDNGRRNTVGGVAGGRCHLSLATSLLEATNMKGPERHWENAAQYSQILVQPLTGVFPFQVRRII